MSGPGDRIPCQWCGEPREVDWVEVTTWGDLEPQYVPGRPQRCATPDCQPLCRICRRPPGDIHSAECATIVLGKVGDRVRVELADCGAPS